MGKSTYVGDPDIHDSSILRVRHEKDAVRVLLRAYSGRRFALEFIGVASMRTNRPEGMLLYAVTAETAEEPLHRFSFANWRENDDACLEIVAHEFRIVEEAESRLA